MTDLNSWRILIIPVFLFLMSRIHMDFCIYIFFKVLRRLFGNQCSRIVVIRVKKQFLYGWESLRHHRGRSVFFQSYHVPGCSSQLPLCPLSVKLYRYFLMCLFICSFYFFCLHWAISSIQFLDSWKKNLEQGKPSAAWEHLVLYCG